MSNRRYDYDPEPGNDFTYDEHGNVIYGRGYIGPPRRPMYYGLDVNNFLEPLKDFKTIYDKYRNIVNLLKQ